VTAPLKIPLTCSLAEGQESPGLRIAPNWRSYLSTFSAMARAMSKITDGGTFRRATTLTGTKVSPSGVVVSMSATPKSSVNSCGLCHTAAKLAYVPVSSASGTLIRIGTPGSPLPGPSKGEGASEVMAHPTGRPRSVEMAIASSGSIAPLTAQEPKLAGEMRDLLLGWSTSSDGSGPVVVGGEGPRTGWPVCSVCPMTPVGARRCRSIRGPQVVLSCAVAFEVELGLPGLVDRFDDRAERLEETLARQWWFVFRRRTDEGEAEIRAVIRDEFPTSSDRCALCQAPAHRRQSVSGRGRRLRGRRERRFGASARRPGGVSTAGTRNVQSPSGQRGR